MKSILGYLSCVAIALFYTFFWDAHWGMLIVTVLIVAPILSISVAIASKNRLLIALECHDQTINKGDKIVIAATFKKTGFLPVPGVEVRFFNDRNLAASQDNYYFPISGNDECTLRLSYTAQIWGQAKIGLKEIVVVDYLSLVRFTLYQEDGAHTYTKLVGIIPNIPAVPDGNELIRALLDAVAYDDNEETKENVLRTSGFPGYEHKTYSPGDSVRKINWKLSSKRDMLMVRLDEAVSSAKQALVVDCCGKAKTQLSQAAQDQQLLEEERIIEAILGVASIFVKQGIESVVYYFINNWIQSTISTMEDVVELQQSFAKFKFQSQTAYREGYRIPLDDLMAGQNNSAFTVFTSCFDTELFNELEHAQRLGAVVHTVVTAPANRSVENAWLVNESFEFMRI